MRFGRFDDENLEYVITTPETPLPWINYLGSEAYFGIISNTAGGYSFYKDARLRRITRYRYNNAPLDVGGRYIYLRDDQPQNLISGPPPGSPPENHWMLMNAVMVWGTPGSNRRAKVSKLKPAILYRWVRTSRSGS